jgi:hypothetical protein
MNAQACTATARGDLAPGELSRLTAECLAAAGIVVTSGGPGPELELELHPGPDPWLGEQAGEADAERWTLAVDDYARARLDYAPAQARAADPHRIAAIAAALLTGTPPADGPPGDHAPAAGADRSDDDGPGDGIMRTAGLDLRRRGLAVALSAITDDEDLELSCDLRVTAPGDDPHDPATAWIADNGTIQFDRSYWAGHAAEERRPRYRTWLPDPAACAAAIADTVTAAIAAAQPPEADRAVAAENGRGARR